MPRDKADTYSFFFLLLLTIAFFLEPIAGDVTFYFRDLFHWGYPAKAFYVEELKNGRFPLWNPYQYLGTPYAANISMSVYYPLNVLFFVLPFYTAFKYHIIVHYFLFGLFNYVFLRGLRVSPFSSSLASVVLMFSGYVVFLHSQSIFLQSAIWLPLVLYFFMKSLHNNRAFTWIVFTCLALSVQCLGGNPQDVFVSLLFMLFIGFHKVLFAKEKASSAKAFVRAFGSVGVLSLGLSAIQLLPAAELISLASRGAGLSFDQATIYSFNPVRLLEFVIPFPFGTIIPDNTYYGQFLINGDSNLPWTLSVYLGLLPLFFIIVASLRNKSISSLFIFIALFFLFISFGKHTPAYYLCHKIVPGFGLFRYPEKYLFAVTFSLAVLSGFGCDGFFRFNGFLKRIASRSHATRRARLKRGYRFVEKWAVFTVVTISACCVMLLLFDSALIAGYRLLFKALHIRLSSDAASSAFLKSLVHFTSFSIPLLLLTYAYRKGSLRKSLFQTLVMAVLFADVALANKNLVYYTPHQLYEATPQLAARISALAKETGRFRIHRTPMTYAGQYANEATDLNRYEKQRLWEKNTLKKNIGTVYHLPYFDGYETFEIRDYVEFFDALKQYPAKLLSLLNVRYIIVPEKDTYFTEDDSFLPRLQSIQDRVKVVENTRCFKRAFIVPNAVCSTGAAELLNKICETGFDFATTVAIQTEKPCPSAGGNVGLERASDKYVCTIVAYEPDYVRIDATVKHDAYLVLSDTYYPGWNGFVDGKKVPVLKANYVLRALSVPKGSHTIEFRYEPTSFKLGMVVTVLTVLLLVVLALCLNKDSQYRR